MRKYVLLLISFFVIAAGSCKKDDQKPVHESSWTLNGTKYNIEFIIWSGSGGSGQYSLQDKDGNTLRLSFLTKPTGNTTYELVSSENQLTGSQFNLEVVGSFGVFTYKGYPITVNATSNKNGMTILIPEITLKSKTQPDAKLGASFFIP